MPVLDIIMDPQEVNDYLEANDLGKGWAPIHAVLMQTHGATESGQPAIMFVIEVDGKKVLAKTTYRLFMAAVGGIQGTLVRLEASR